MTRIFVALGVSAITAASVFAAPAAASGPGGLGKEAKEIECAGLGTITVSTPKPESSKGAGQIVGQQGHGKPVSFTFVVTDLRTGEAVFPPETQHVGGEKAHAHQETTLCKGTFFEGPAEVFFEGGELPEGVEPEDTIRASFEAPVVVKP